MNKKIIFYKKRAYEEAIYTMRNKSIVQELINYYYTLPYWKREKLVNNFSSNFYNFFFNKIKEEIKIKKEKTRNIKSSLDDLNKILYHLNICFTINKNVKKKAYEHNECSYCDGAGCSYCDYDGVYTEVDYAMRDNMYKNKTALIIFCISEIQKRRLPIKYGKNDGIVYFEYCSKQVSFHDPKNQINCKPFKGVWNEIPNIKIPFNWVKKN
jgi:hypothetical protein